MSSIPDRRKKQVSKSVKKHRKERDRLEVYIPRGWRERLKKINDQENISTSQWVRDIVAHRIGENKGK